MRLLSFDAGDEECSKVVFLIVDGAHRRWVCVHLNLKMLWARFVQPTMSYGDLVRTPLLCVCVCAGCVLYSLHLVSCVPAPCFLCPCTLFRV